MAAGISCSMALLQVLFTHAPLMKWRMQTPAGRRLYAKRKSTIEPVFGIIKAAMGFRQFLLRGLQAVGGEWTLVCLAWNMKRLHGLKMTQA